MKKIVKKEITRNPTRTRRRLLETAIQLFADRGYDGVAMDDVARRARINKRMIYHYFGNKAGLYAAVLTDVFKRLEVVEVSALSESETPEAAISAVMHQYFDFFEHNPEFVQLLAWENLHRGRFLKQHPKVLTKYPMIVKLKRVIEQGQSRGRVRKDIDVRHLLIGLIALCYIYFANRYTLSQSIGLNLFSSKEMSNAVQHAVEIALYGIVHHRPS